MQKPENICQELAVHCSKRDLVEVQPEGETLEALVVAAGQLEQEGPHHVLHTQSSSFIRLIIITVIVQSYVSRLPKY